jgi:LysR family transcriptional regulator for metE and metH
MEIELRDLRMVRMIVEAGNLTKAAGRLNISQPALSRQLLDLEARLGASLFQRQPRSMILTDIGREVLKVADEVLERIGQTERTIARRLDGHCGELKFGVHCIFSFSWLPEVIKTFQRHYPEITITINSTEDYVKDLNRDRCEIALTPFVVSDGNIVYDELFTDDVVAILAPDHPLAAKASLSLEDFGQTGYIAFLGRSFDPFNAMLKAAGVVPQTHMVLNQASALTLMVRSGLGIALVPQFSVKSLVAAGKLKQCTVAGVPLRWKWLAAHRQGHPLPPYANAFIEMIRYHMAIELSQAA